MNIVVVGGIRAHYIKINALQKVLRLYPNVAERVNVIYVDVAQHYDAALTGFKQELGLSFDYVLQHDTTDSFAREVSIFAKIGEVFDDIQKSRKIDYVAVMGDVATTLIVATAAVIKHLKVAHIESGVRVTLDGDSEEYYRVATDHISSVCFASAKADFANLRKEGFGTRAVFSGDIIYDYIKHCKPFADSAEFNYGRDGELVRFDCHGNDYILFSLHHEENLNYENLQNVFTAVNETAHKSIFIAHPRVKRMIKELGVKTYNTEIADFIPYLDNLKAIANCRYALTDSGGIQREAYYFNKRCIVRSNSIVWHPIVASGSNITSEANLNALRSAISYAESHLCMPPVGDVGLGDGTAVKTIFKTLLERK